MNNDVYHGEWKDGKMHGKVNVISIVLLFIVVERIVIACTLHMNNGTSCA